MSTWPFPVLLLNLYVLPVMLPGAIFRSSEHVCVSSVASWSDLSIKQMAHTQFPGPWTPTAEGSPHLYVVFNEARRLDTSLHVETDVHLHLGLLVCQLDDWHLKAGKVTSISKHYRQVISLKKKSVCVVMAVAVGGVTWNQQKKKNSNCLKWQPFRGKTRSAISYLLSCQSAQHCSLQWLAWSCVHTPQRILHAPSAPTVLLQL